MPLPSPSPATWSTPTIAELQPYLPQYLIESLLGQGGMGAVYRAQQVALHRPVAIKVLPLGHSDEYDDPAERFAVEARAMARLTHPGIVAVYDFGQTASGLLYYVMEFVDGTDVHRMVSEQGSLRAEQALAIAANVCEALAYAHENAVVHRDIKPANILISRTGQVKIADFGLARMDNPAVGLTQVGLVMGSPDYVAPEALVSSHLADHRGDLYAVGVMLYYMLTAEVPRGVFQMPSQQVPGLDPRFDPVITRAMQRDPTRRYQTADAMHAALHTLATTPPTPSLPKATSPNRRPLMPMLTISALTVLATTASVAFFLGQSPDAPVRSADVAPAIPHKAPALPPTPVVAKPDSIVAEKQMPLVAEANAEPTRFAPAAPTPAVTNTPPSVVAPVVAMPPVKVLAAPTPIIVAQAKTTSPLEAPPADSPFVGEWEYPYPYKEGIARKVLLPDGSAELWRNKHADVQPDGTNWYSKVQWSVTEQGVRIADKSGPYVSEWKYESPDRLVLISSTTPGGEPKEKVMKRAITNWRIKANTTTSNPTASTIPSAAPSAPAPLAANAPAELTVLQQQYDKLLAERVTGVYDAARLQLDTGYTGGLERAMAEAQKTGELDTVLALEDEKKRIAAQQPAPATDDATTPEALKKLRTIYRAALAKLDTERSTNLANLILPFATRLKQLEADLTKQARIPDAKVVKEYREGLAGVVVVTETKTPDAPKEGTKPPNGSSGATPTVTNAIDSALVETADGDLLRAGHRYRFIHIMATWPEAEEHCRKLGGHLVSISSKAEWDALLKFSAKTSQGINWWTGLRRPEGQLEPLTWSDGTKYDFKGGWPANKSATITDPTRSCVLVVVVDKEWRFYPEDTKGCKFICEWDKP